VPALQLGNGILGRGERPPAGRQLAVAIWRRTSLRRKQVRQLHADGRQDRRCIATGVAMQQHPAVVAGRDAQAGVAIIVCRAAGRPAALYASNALEPRKNRI
jgi:hypothetical protein